MTIPRQAKQKAVPARNPMVCNLPFSFFLQFFTRKTKRVALAMAFFSAAADSAQDLAPSSTPAVGAGVSLLVSGAVVGFSLDAPSQIRYNILGTQFHLSSAEGATTPSHAAEGTVAPTAAYGCSVAPFGAKTRLYLRWSGTPSFICGWTVAPSDAGRERRA
ncbi:hypothetical protein LWI28_008476 [Acer negundo]|uniref:Uncharacterized protein n=1 Tax=Acer negundo TaxID=4023 RepID=A0AAD5NPU2_ACENE|nr:hypothetical protein LWI28_008476 [Acer negundo]